MVTGFLIASGVKRPRWKKSGQTLEDLSWKLHPATLLYSVGNRLGMWEGAAKGVNTRSLDPWSHLEALHQMRDLGSVGTGAKLEARK